MTARAVRPPSLAPDVLADLKSPTTTTEQTTKLLRALLGLESDDKGIKAPPKRPQTSKPVKSKDAVRSTSTQSKGTNKTIHQRSISVYDENETSAKPLPVAGRLKLATEAFNGALRLLSELSKAKAAANKDSIGVDNGKHDGSSPQEQALLVQRSPNRPGKQAKPTKPSGSKSNNETSVVECAVIALTCLQNTARVDGEGDSAFHAQQDRGGLMLLDRLIALGLVEKATQMATSLYMQYVVRQLGYHDTSSKSKSAKSIDLHDMLAIAPPIESRNDFNFVTSLQSQILRLFILSLPGLQDGRILHQIKLQVAGSPASNIIEGEKHGHIDKEKAGLQLRTISQAILRICAQEIQRNTVGTNESEVTYHMKVEALFIKIKSWHYLGHKPHLEKELWPHLLHAGRKFQVDHTLPKAKKCETIITSFRATQIILRDCSFVSEYPQSVSLYLADIAEENGQFELAIRLLDEYCSYRQTNRTQHWTITWIRSSLLSKTSMRLTKRSSDAFGSALKSLSMVLQADMLSEHGLSLLAARLRKAAVNVLLAIDSTTGDSSERDDTSILAECCLKILTSLLVLSSKLFDNKVGAEESPATSTATTALAKSVESLLDIARLSAVALCNNEILYLASLRSCVTAVKRLQHATEIRDKPDEKQDVLVESLSVRLSNLLWQHYLRLQEANHDSGVHLPILDDSIAVLPSGRLNTSNSGSLGMKLEQRSSILLHLKEYAAAGAALESNLQHHIAIGTLADVTTASLNQSLSSIWMHAPAKRNPLRRTLSSFVKNALSHRICCSTTSTWYFDDVNLPDEHRFVLLEAQIVQSADQTVTRCDQESLLECIQLVLQLSSAPVYRVWQARFALQLLCLSSKHVTFPGKAALSTEVIDKLCETHFEDSTKPVLGGYHAWLSSALRLQWALESDKPDPRTLLEMSEMISVIVQTPHDLTALNAVVDDISNCLKQLQLMLSYSQALDNVDHMICCEVAICHILKLQPSSSIISQQRVSHLSTLGGLYCRKGDISKADHIFGIARDLLTIGEELSVANIRWALAFTDHLIQKNDLKEAMEVFSQAQELFGNLFPKSVAVTGRVRLQRDTILSRAALLASRLAYLNGSLSYATLSGKQAIKISTGLWQTISNVRSQKQQQDLTSNNDTSMHNLSADMTNLTLSSAAKSTSGSLKTGGAVFWEVLELHCSILLYMNTLMAHNGLYQDAIHYVQQLSSLAKSVGSLELAARANVHLGALFARSGELDKAKPCIAIHCPDGPDKASSLDHETTLLLIEALIECRLYNQARLHLERERHMLDTKVISSGVAKFSNASMTSARSRAKQASARALQSSGPRRAGNRRPPKTADSTPQPNSSKVTYRESLLRETISYLEELLLFCDSNGSSRATHPIQPRMEDSTSKLPQRQQLLAKQILQMSLREMSSDSVKCVLAETAVALPVKNSRRRVSGRVSIIQSETSPIKARGKRRQNGDQVKSIDQDVVQLTSAEQRLLDAHKLLVKSKEDHTRMTTYNCHTFGKLETKLALFGSTTDSPFTLSPLDVVLKLLQPKEIVHNREVLVSVSEKSVKNKERICDWPVIESVCTNKDFKNTTTETVSVTEVACIPASWNVISISLAEDVTEIMVSKMVADESPFMLRIPLSRSDLDTADGTEFTYHAAKSAFDSIVSQTNASCHDFRGQGSKQERQAWYQERQELDQELGEWLFNIENVWLGGFRGLLSPNCFDDGDRSTFETALAAALNEHLPSRQRLPLQRSTRLDLHDHVLDLFLGLGDPDDYDLDDAITDLLYFVIDILQFSGEQNAYDEIDFDALITEVLDALRHCHARLRVNAQKAARHTILILDKELAAYPWESLPCLQQQSVSRMPSLRAVVERAQRVRLQQCHEEGYTISSTKGAYMLNPSSDLLSTESTFQPIFERNLSSFSSTIRTPPTEPIFESLLQGHELFLYFGHGSGAQYVRGRTIRAMDSCAVTLLMGCSSAKMTECGQFESHGMPGYYIGGMSGCMAMVGTLWDVTDRDIDRFAVKLLAEWGLVEDDDLVQKALERSNKKNATVRKKAGAKQPSKRAERMGKVSLDQAVSKSRDACLLKYLNGAAPVVYGVPVYLG